MMAPKDSYALILRTSEYVALHSKGKLSLQTELILLSGRKVDYLGLLGGRQYNHKGP